MRGQFAANVGITEEMRQRAADGPVHVAETVQPVLVVCEQTTLVAQDRRLVDEQLWRDVWCIGELVELALFSDNGSDELAVVFEQHVVCSRATGFEDELRGEIAKLTGRVCHHRRRRRRS